MTNKTVTESIFSRGGWVIPMAEVQHIEPRGEDGRMVVMKSSTYNLESDEYNNAIYMDKRLADVFVPAWCRYRSELEAKTLMNLQPTPPKETP